MANRVWVVGEDGDVVQREVSFEIGEDEAYKKGLFGVGAAWDVNLKGVTDAWQKEWLRGSQRLDKYEDLAVQQYLDHKEERFDSRQRLQEKLDNIFAGGVARIDERMGAAQGAQANQMLFDPQKMAETVSEAGMAASAQTQEAAQSAMASGLANQAWTQSAVQSAIAADVAESLRPSIVAMGDAIANAVIRALSE